jgi:predicted CopG family antitoxin
MSKPIKLNDEIIKKLDAMKHIGQSYGGVIQELIDFWEKNKK